MLLFLQNVKSIKSFVFSHNWINHSNVNSNRSELQSCVFTRHLLWYSRHSVTSLFTICPLLMLLLSYSLHQTSELYITYVNSTSLSTEFPMRTALVHTLGEEGNESFIAQEPLGPRLWYQQQHNPSPTSHTKQGHYWKRRESLWATGASRWVLDMIQQWNIQVMTGSKRGIKRDSGTQRESQTGGRRRWSVREVDRRDRVDGREWMVWETAIETERMRTREEENACYRGRVAVWGLPFLQRCHLVLMTERPARRGGTCAKAMGGEALSWRITDGK